MARRSPSILLHSIVAVGLLSGCRQGAPDEVHGSPPSGNLLEVAENHARRTLPAAQVPSGLERAWWVEDHGDVWIVEFGHQNTPGGGIRMMVRKSDMQVVDTTLTQ